MSQVPTELARIILDYANSRDEVRDELTRLRYVISTLGEIYQRQSPHLNHTQPCQCRDCYNDHVGVCKEYCVHNIAEYTEWCGVCDTNYPIDHFPIIDGKPYSQLECGLCDLTEVLKCRPENMFVCPNERCCYEAKWCQSHYYSHTGIDPPEEPNN